jgi:hypothetical protein
MPNDEEKGLFSGVDFEMPLKEMVFEWLTLRYTIVLAFVSGGVVGFVLIHHLVVRPLRRRRTKARKRAWMVNNYTVKKV